MPGEGKRRVRTESDTTVLVMIIPPFSRFYLLSEGLYFLYNHVTIPYLSPVAHSPLLSSPFCSTVILRLAAPGAGSVFAHEDNAVALSVVKKL